MFSRRIALIVPVLALATLLVAADVTGKCKGQIEGNKVDFSMDSEWQGNPVKLLLNGTVEGNELRLTVSSENGEWNAGLTAKRQ